MSKRYKKVKPPRQKTPGQRVQYLRSVQEATVTNTAESEDGTPFVDDSTDSSPRIDDLKRLPGSQHDNALRGYLKPGIVVIVILAAFALLWDMRSDIVVNKTEVINLKEDFKNVEHDIERGIQSLKDELKDEMRETNRRIDDYISKNNK